MELSEPMEEPSPNSPTGTPLLPEARPDGPSSSTESAAEEPEAPAPRKHVKHEAKLGRDRLHAPQKAKHKAAKSSKLPRRCTLMPRRKSGAVRSSICEQGKKEWDPYRHFRHQVRFLDQLFPQLGPKRPFERRCETFMGTLGTGIVGVRPKRRASQAKGARQSMSNQAAGYIVLFLNAASAKIQEWSGKTLSGYKPSLNLQTRTLLWESQRSDLGGKVINRIASCALEGTMVVVAVRAAPNDSYRELGRTRSFRLESTSQLLLGAGDHIIVERGSNRIHRSILAQCLDGGLSSGIGLVRTTFPPRFTPQFCTACCRTRATARLEFATLDAEAAAMLAPPEAAVQPPTKRLRGKQSYGGRSSQGTPAASHNQEPVKVAGLKRELFPVKVEREAQRLKDEHLPIKAEQAAKLKGEHLPIKVEQAEPSKRRWRRLLLDAPSMSRVQHRALLVERHELLARLAKLNAQLAGHIIEC